MSSVRISQHGRSGAVPVGSGSESGRADAPSGRASFAVALGAAALVQKGSGPVLSGSKGTETADGGPASRKRATGDGKNADAAAMLAAQGVLLAASGEPLSLPAHDVVDDRAAPGNAADSNLTNASISAAEPPVADLLSGSGPADSVPAGRLLDPSQTTLETLPGEPARMLLQTAASDSLATNSSSADALAEADGLASNLGPQLPTVPNLHVSEALPAAMTGLAQGLPPAAAGRPGAGSEDAASGGDSRGRFMPIAAAGERGRAAEAAAFGATGEPSALANAPSAAPTSAAAADASATATVSDQVASHALRLVASGSREMVMRLHPPELGEVTVRVAVNGRDVSAWFGSPQPQVQIAIADGIAQLQTGLGNAGYNLSGAWVGADASGARQQAAGSTPPPAMPAAGAAEPILPNAAVSQPPASAVNIYV